MPKRRTLVNVRAHKRHVVKHTHTPKQRRKRAAIIKKNKLLSQFQSMRPAGKKGGKKRILGRRPEVQLLAYE